MKRQSILIFGDMYPHIVHGISISNKLNFNLLKVDFDVFCVEESIVLDNHNKLSTSKFTNNIYNCFKIYKTNKKKSFDFYYSTFHLSLLGSIKTLIALYVFKLSGEGIRVLHIHRGDFDLFYNKSFINQFICKLIFSNINKLIVLSHSQLIYFNKFINSNYIYILENSLLSEYPLQIKSCEGIRFLYLSNYTKEKGILDLLEVFDRITATPNEIILECYGGFIDGSIREIILQYSSDRISINGTVFDADKFEVISKSDCLVFPSWNEGQPIVILEAMSQGLIIITTKVGLISEMLGDDYPFYFEPNNPGSLESCVKKYLLYKFKNELSLTLKERYEGKYSQSKHNKQLLKVFK